MFGHDAGVAQLESAAACGAQSGPGVLMDVADMDAVMAAMETPGGAEAMAHEGVVAETLVILVEA